MLCADGCVSFTSRTAKRTFCGKIEYDREYYRRNKDNKSLSIREYYHQHKDDIDEASREHYKRNKEDKRNYSRDYGVRKLLEKKDYNRDFYLRNQDNIRDAKRAYYVQKKDDKKEYNRFYYLRSKAKRRRPLDFNREYQQNYYIQNKENSELYTPRESLLKSWKSPELVREYFDSIATQLHISNHSDWYRISRLQIGDLGGMCLSFFYIAILIIRLALVYQV
jgi:hypothetical protein